MGYNADASISGEETVYEFYTEASIPLAEGAAWAEYLGLEVGGRYSDYDHAGSVDTWKIGAEWQLPVPIRFRTMLQRSVRAPTLQESFTEQGLGVWSFSGNNGNGDPCSAGNDPVGSGFAEHCIATGLPANELGFWTATPAFPTDYLFGGNPEVEPESADTITAGVVFDIDWLQGMQVSIDYFSLEVEDTIGDLDASLACFDLANTTQQFCSNIQRDSLSNNVDRVVETTINRGLFTAEGIDTQVSLEMDLPGGLAVGDSSASLGVDMIWTHTLENSYQETTFGTTFECEGSWGFPCRFARWTMTYPENRINTDFSYFSGDFNARLSWRWIEGTTNGLVKYKDQIGLGWAEIGIVDVPSKSYFDLNFAYRISDNIDVGLSIVNVGDTKPVLMGDYAVGANTDPGVYDVFGRAYTLSLSLQY